MPLINNKSGPTHVIGMVAKGMSQIATGISATKYWFDYMWLYWSLDHVKQHIYHNAAIEQITSWGDSRLGNRLGPLHHAVMKWKRLPHHWPFVRESTSTPVKGKHISLLTWISYWTNTIILGLNFSLRQHIMHAFLWLPAVIMFGLQVIPYFLEKKPL